MNLVGISQTKQKKLRKKASRHSVAKGEGADGMAWHNLIEKFPRISLRILCSGGDANDAVLAERGQSRKQGER